MPGKYPKDCYLYWMWESNLQYITDNNLSATNHLSAKVEITLELELYDMVHVKKNYDAAGLQLKNYFEGRMLA